MSPTGRPDQSAPPPNLRPDERDAPARYRSRDPGVRSPSGYQRSDARIREDLCELLMHDDELDVRDVSVDVLNARVTLIGTVPERWMRYALEDRAADLPGVVDVDNQVRVARGQQRERTAGE